MTKGHKTLPALSQVENQAKRAAKGIDLDRAYQTLIRAYVDVSVAKYDAVNPAKNERLNARTLRKEQIT
jgi:hypothetical protein